MIIHKSKYWTKVLWTSKFSCFNWFENMQHVGPVWRDILEYWVIIKQTVQARIVILWLWHNKEEKKQFICSSSVPGKGGNPQRKKNESPPFQFSQTSTLTWKTFTNSWQHCTALTSHLHLFHKFIRDLSCNISPSFLLLISKKLKVNALVRDLDKMWWETTFAWLSISVQL